MAEQEVTQQAQKKASSTIE
ncbi:rCG53408 [Rattus norvegicus]|uniref:RCG53408 n=1 Tax=Rattus norvegicus TaxID=10116 RepID=A6JRN3_RAT|nr:rCG53408 [Rattus norvegicus]